MNSNRIECCNGIESYRYKRGGNISIDVFHSIAYACLLGCSNKNASNDTRKSMYSRNELSHYFIYESIKFYVAPTVKLC